MSRHGNPAIRRLQDPLGRDLSRVCSRANGYFVGHVGKWHNGKFPAENFDFGRSYCGTHWMTQPDGTKIHVTKKNENDALEFLRDRPTDKPFCLTLAFFATHAEDRQPQAISAAAGEHAALSGRDDPRAEDRDRRALPRLPPFIANEKNEGRVRWHWRFDTPEKYQEMMKNYYRLATEVDATCGRVLAELKKQGVLDNTLVIFTGDNGYFHGEHGLADKWYPHEESIRVPLIVRDPRMPPAKRGQHQRRLHAERRPRPDDPRRRRHRRPDDDAGPRLRPALSRGEKPAWRTEFFYEHAIIHSIDFIPSSEALVRKDWKYFYWPDFKHEQLFDLRPIHRRRTTSPPTRPARSSPKCAIALPN